MSSGNNYNYMDGNSGKLVYKGSVDSGFQEPIDIQEHSSPLTSPVLDRRGMQQPTMIQDQQLQQQIASIKHQQEMQQQLLLRQYEKQRQELAKEHEKQIQEHLKVSSVWRKTQELEELHQQMMYVQKQQEYLEQFEQQKKFEEHQRMEKEMREKECLQHIKNKGKEEESAIASIAVKQKLQEFVLNKKQREAATGTVTNSPPQFKHWMAHHPQGGSVDTGSPPQSGLSPPYGPAGLLGKFEDDFPLRKTASEPNIYKVRSALKQKVIERRISQSPMLRRRDKGLLALRRKQTISIDTQVCSSPDSGPNSPGSAHGGAIHNGSLTSLHKEEGGSYPYSLYRGLGYGTDYSLYTSPSMPNISLGRPPTSGASSASSNSSALSETDVHAIGPSGIPYSGQVLPGMGPFYPSLHVVDGDISSNPSYISAHIKALEEARASGRPLITPYAIPANPSTGISTGVPDTSTAHRLHRHRPLGRTQSAPLPLGHPLLQQQPTLFLQQQQQQEQLLKDNPKLHLKQHLRQTVLQRAGSKSHMENVDEETEAKLAQEMKESREQGDNEAILLKDEKMDDIESSASMSSLEKVPKDVEAFHLQPREILKLKHGRGPSHHRPLARTQSSPLVTFSMSAQQQQQSDSGATPYRFITGLVYDSLMLKHQCSCSNNSNHPENESRLRQIWSRLQERGIVTRCEKLKSRKATIDEIQTCHTEAYTSLYASNPFNRAKLDQKILESLPLRFCVLPCGGIGVDSDTFWSEHHTTLAARMAAGCVTELALRVASGELKNGMAIVRPPGHHAESQQAMGFCYFNSIAIAAKQIIEKLKMERILIVDWDVHHGNATQQMFYDNRNVLYISIHRHDNGNFFPGTGSFEDCGAEEGLGYNVNIPFSSTLQEPMGDAEYLAAFRTVVMPIAREFKPEVVLVSAGFDAAVGHPAPLGGYLVTPACFGHMTCELMSLAGGKVILALEGGYDIQAICDCAELCCQALLGDELPCLKQEELCRPPQKAALETLETAIRTQVQHWEGVIKYLGTIHYSLIEAQKSEMEEADTVSALASLSMVPGKGSTTEVISEPMEEEPS